MSNKGDDFMSYKIICTNGHYEVYIKGKFICSEDSYGKAAKEAEKYLAERR